VLTDYHVHLREDSDRQPPDAAAFTDGNVERYLTAAREAGVDELGVSEHVYRFAQALELWRHPFWEEQARDDLIAYCEFVRATPRLLGPLSGYHFAALAVALFGLVCFARRQKLLRGSIADERRRAGAPAPTVA